MELQLVFKSFRHDYSSYLENAATFLQACPVSLLHLVNNVVYITYILMLILNHIFMSQEIFPVGRCLLMSNNTLPIEVSNIQ